MLAVILKILSVLGIILLILLCVFLLVLLLVLFMPITYKIDAEKSDDKMNANVRMRWLFGFLRGCYVYPEPGKIIVKVLWKTIYDSSSMTVKKNDTTHTNTSATTDERKESHGFAVSEQASAINQAEENVSSNTAETNAKKSLTQKLFEKYDKIIYTIRQFCDKIKQIWNNISFYKKLFQDEQTKLLISHVFRRLGKVLRHVRPGKLKADVIFGTGSPDTTGYMYGIYGMFSPQLGKNVFITPDFTQKICNGTVHATGHITIFTLSVNVLAVLLDKRLQILLRRLKAHSVKQEKPTN